VDKLTRPSTVAAYLTVTAAQVMGGASLLLLGVFLFRGPFHFVDLHLSTPAALLLDGFLCLAFCVQHSGMVRQSFRQRLEVVVPRHYHGAVYAITSGGMLLALLILWQGAAPNLLSLDGAGRWLVRGLAVAAIFGFIWGVRALDSFDTFGVRPVMAKLRGKELRDLPLTIRGPYKWVRHPLYTCVLLLLWSSPDVSADRLLLNIIWTVWVVLGTVLEERDLVSRFGKSYIKYQRDVPMLIPWRVSSSADSK
jgi:protein-S-isoprenylcysteine O-methyltransferase Ste14